MISNFANEYNIKDLEKAQSTKHAYHFLNPIMLFHIRLFEGEYKSSLTGMILSLGIYRDIVKKYIKLLIKDGLVERSIMSVYDKDHNQPVWPFLLTKEGKIKVNENEKHYSEIYILFPKVMNRIRSEREERKRLFKYTFQNGFSA